MLRLESHPAPPLAGAFTPPGDKSITHRAFLLGLLHPGALRIVNANPGADCAASRTCALRLGARDEDGHWIGAGERLAEPDDVLDCGNSGTTLRLLAGIVAARPILAVLTGDASLRARPLARVMEPLARMGATLESRRGSIAPLVVRGAPLVGIEHRCEVASAQVLSCVLLAGLGAEGRTVVELPGPARDHTERMLAAFGVPLAIDPLGGGGRRVAIRGPAPLAGADRELRVPGDFSAAAFFLSIAAARPGARVTARAVSLNPTRTGLLAVLERMGARIERTAVRLEHGEEVGDVTVEGAALRGVELQGDALASWIDEVPAWAMAAALARGTSRLTGAAELRVKESDRIARLAENLAALGIGVRELPDGIEIEGGTPSGGRVRAGGDHRIAMAFAALGGAARRTVTIDDASSVATSFPGFAAAYRELGGALDPDEVAA